MDSGGESTRYEIVVKDRISPRLGSAFAGVEVDARPGQTVLTGDFSDQEHLHGLLDRASRTSESSW